MALLNGCRASGDLARELCLPSQAQLLPALVGIVLNTLPAGGSSNPGSQSQLGQSLSLSSATLGLLLGVLVWQWGQLGGVWDAISGVSGVPDGVSREGPGGGEVASSRNGDDGGGDQGAALGSEAAGVSERQEFGGELQLALLELLSDDAEQRSPGAR